MPGSGDREEIFRLLTATTWRGSACGTGDGLAGEHVYLQLAIAYRDDRQPWEGSRSYHVRIEP